jgi:hypothetical protein
MGEIADMMLDGTLCQSCGEYLDQEPCGYPVSCGGCAGFNDAEVVVHVELDMQKPAQCPDCTKRFKNGSALGMHWDDKHSPEALLLKGIAHKG